MCVDADGVPVPGSELGVARRRALFEPGDGADPATRWVLTLTKALARSTVHRDVPLDFVGVRRFGADGAWLDETHFLGLYTANVYSQATETIPVLRRKVAQVLARSGFPLDSHDGRALAHVLETYPRDELFRLGVDELAELAIGIVAMGQRRRVRLFVSHDRRGLLRVVPRVPAPRPVHHHDARSRSSTRCAGRSVAHDVDFTVLVTEEVMARLHVVVSTPDGARAVDPLAVEAELAVLVRTWVDDLHDAFVDARGEEAGRRRLPHLDATRSPPRTSSRSAPATRSPTSRCSTASIPPATSRSGSSRRTTTQVARIKLYRAGGALVLSDVMPLLEHLDVTVVDERPYEIAAPDGRPRWIYSFGVRSPRPVIRSAIPTCRPASPTSSSACGRARSRTTA